MTQLPTNFLHSNARVGPNSSCQLSMPFSYIRSSIPPLVVVACLLLIIYRTCLSPWSFFCLFIEMVVFPIVFRLKYQRFCRQKPYAPQKFDPMQSFRRWNQEANKMRKYMDLEV